MVKPALLTSVGFCLLVSVAVVWAALAEAPQSITVQFPQNAEQTFDQALREAFLTAIQQMMPPHAEDSARQHTSAIIREADKIHDSWRSAFNALSRQVTTAQKLWQQASKELGDALEKISNLQAEILKKNREYREAQEIDTEYQRQIVTASKWQIVVPLDVTYPYTMPRGQALDHVQNTQLERLIELGRGVHLQAVDVVRQGELKQSIVIAGVSGKLIPEGETVIQHVDHPRRNQRRIIAVRTFSVLPLLHDEQMNKGDTVSEATQNLILNNEPLHALSLHEEASTAFMAQFSSPRNHEIHTMITRAIEHNEKTRESVAQILQDWEKIRPTINLAMIKEETRKAEEFLASEQKNVAVLEEKEKVAKAKKKEVEDIYKTHLDEFRIILHKSGVVNVGELDVVKVTLKKALELYDALKLEANENRYKSITRLENFVLSEELMQQKFRNLRLLELKLLPIGSHINAEGHEIITLTLLGVYGLNSAESNDGDHMTAALIPSAGVAQERQHAAPEAQGRDGQGDMAAPMPDQERSAEALHAVPESVPQRQGQEAVAVQLAPEQVQLVQLQLQELGFNPGSADGVFGRRTEAALRQYQAHHALPITGWPDEETRRSLDRQASQVRQRQPASQTSHVGRQRRASEPKRLLNEVSGFFHRILKPK